MKGLRVEGSEVVGRPALVAHLLSLSLPALSASVSLFCPTKCQRSTPPPMSVKIMRSEGLSGGQMSKEAVLSGFKLFFPHSGFSQEPRKLSYAEVCQRPPKDPPPATPAPAPSGPSGPSSGQPLRELRVNKPEEPSSSSGPADKQEKGHDKEGGWELKESRPARERDSQGYYRSNGPRSSGALKFRDQRRQPQVRRSSPQGGHRHAGKEQNIPPVSPK